MDAELVQEVDFAKFSLGAAEVSLAGSGEPSHAGTGSLTLGKEGVEKIHGLGELSAYEQKSLDAMMPELKDSINKGVEFAKSM